MSIAIVWVVFLAVVGFLILLDLGVFHREAHEITVKEALSWTIVWVAFALLVNVGVYFLYRDNWFNFLGHLSPLERLNPWHAAQEFFTGYVVELTLSVDNLFVMAVIFRFFNVPKALQHTVLFWGILTAVILRGVMIAFFGVLIKTFEVPTYLVFGGLLFWSGVKMLTQKEEEIDPDQSWIIRQVKKFYPVSSAFDGKKFFTKLNGKTAITPLGLALVLVEGADVMFAIDSVPAIYVITKEPFLVFTSNICAIMGLRSMYFALAGMMDRFHHLKSALAYLLAFIGIKMLLIPLQELIHMTTGQHVELKINRYLSLAIIAGILMTGVLASLITKPKHEKGEEDALVQDRHPENRT